MTLFIRLLSLILCMSSVCLMANPSRAQSVAKDKPVLTVYTYRSFAGKYGPGPALKEKFEATCSCRLEWVQTDDAATLLSRIKLEGENTKADIVLGLDTNLTAEARATNLFTSHTTPLTGLSLPVAWVDDTFIPFDWSWFAFVYDSRKLSGAPLSFDEFLKRDDIKIVIQDPRTSTPGLGLMIWIRALYGDKANEIWSKLSPKIITVTRSWSEAYGLFLKGEADMVLSYTTSPAYHIGVENKTYYRAAMFKEGHYLQVEVAGRLKNTDQPQLANKFMDFLLSEAAQSAIAEKNWMYPAKLLSLSLPEAFRTLAKPEKSLLMEPETVRQGRRQWIDDWLASVRK